MGWRKRLLAFGVSFGVFYWRSLRRMWPVWLFLFLDSSDMWDRLAPDQYDGRLQLSAAGRMIVVALTLLWAFGSTYHDLRISVEDSRETRERQRRAKAVADHLGECNVFIGERAPWISPADGTLENLYSAIGQYLRAAMGPAAEGLFAHNPAPPTMTGSQERSGYSAWHRAEHKQHALAKIIQEVQAGTYPVNDIPPPIDLESLNA